MLVQVRGGARENHQYQIIVMSSYHLRSHERSQTAEGVRHNDSKKRKYDKYDSKSLKQVTFRRLSSQLLASSPEPSAIFESFSSEIEEELAFILDQ